MINPPICGIAGGLALAYFWGKSDDMKKMLLMICLAAVVFSCKKDKEGKNAADTTGTITGSISPAGAFLLVYATDAQGKQVSANVAAATGLFKIENLPAGKYLLSVPANPRFNAIGSLGIDVLSGKVSDAGAITFDEAALANADVSGSLLPAGIGTAVTATEVGSGKVYQAAPNAAGAFLFNLPNGQYTISFSVKPQAEAPQSLDVLVAGKPVALGSINCKDVTAGSITGHISPYNGAASVIAANTATGDFVLGSIDYNHGTFNFPVMFPGTYKISFTAYIPYLAPADVMVVVTTGNVADAGTVTMPYNNDTRVLSYKVDGKLNLRYNQACSLDNGRFRFSLQSVSFSGGIPERQTTTTTVLSLAADDITGPGTYLFNGASNSTITFSQVSGLSFGLTKVTTNWAISGTAPVGQLEITAIDPVARTIRGAFSAALVSDKVGTVDKKVTEGTFFLSY